MDENLKGRARGGAARAAKLTPEERKGIAQKAALSRWSSIGQDSPKLPKADYLGVLTIGDMVFPCNFYCSFFHRALAAFLAISDRCSGVSFSALALPPFLPPSFPRATAAGFFMGFSSGSDSSAVVILAMKAASLFNSIGVFVFLVMSIYNMTAQAFQVRKKSN